MDATSNEDRERREGGAGGDTEANQQNVPGSEQGDTAQAPRQGEKDEGGPGARPELPDTEKG